MFSVKEMRPIAQRLSPEGFLREVGPFALVQRPTLEDGTPLPQEATRVVGRATISNHMISLLCQFEDLAVATLPPMSEASELQVGRQPDCDLVLDHTSVSKQHALLRWEAPQARCTLRDLGSTNGTYVNDATVRSEVALRDGDVISFGDVQFWFMLTGSLQQKLRAMGP
jgi:hypothetical protein